MNLNISKVVCCVFLAISFCSFQSATNTSVDKLLEVNKTRETTEIMVKQILDMFEKKYPNVSIMTWGSIEKSIDYDSYYKKVKYIYSSNYTDVEIKELIRLYKSDTMDKYITKTKKIEQQLYNAGKDFGIGIAQLVNSKIK